MSIFSRKRLQCKRFPPGGILPAGESRLSTTLGLSAESLRLIVDTVPGLVAILNAGRELELVNHRVLDYFGKTAEELKHWETSFRHDDRAVG